MISKNLILLLLSLIIFSCKQNNNQASDTSITNLPSSLTEKEGQENQFITLSDEQMKSLNIKNSVIKKEKISYYISAPAVCFPAPENVFVISSPISGRVIAIYAHEGEAVKKGQLLLEIESLEYGSLVADLLQSKAEETYQRNQFDRIQKLFQKKISSQSDFEKAQADYTRSLANYRATKSKLLAVGVSEETIEQIIEGKETDPHLKIYSPMNGSIDLHLVDQGQAVNALDKMLTIINLDQVLVKGFVSPDEADNIQIGDEVIIMQANDSTRKVISKVTSINPALDESNKSVVVNILSKTQKNFPKPRTNLQIEITTTTKDRVIAIPASAISYDEKIPVVFVKHTTNKYEKRRIRIFKNLGSVVLINDGLKENEEIAITQIFSLKALSRFEQFSEE